MPPTGVLEQAVRDLVARQGGRGAADDLAEMLRQATLEANRPDVYGENAGQPGPHMPLGEALIRSETYRSWMARFPDGAPSQGAFRSDPEAIRYSLARPEGVHRTLVTSADASAGTLVAPARGPLVPGLVRPLRIRDLVTVIPTTSDQIDFPREVSRTSAAAPTAEASALTGTTGTKPEGGLTFEIVNVAVRTIAVWVPATRRIVADAPFLRAYVEEYLTQDSEEELEDQIVNGPGGGENFTGILNTAGVPSEAVGAAPATAFDAFRKAIRRIEVDGRTRANAIVMHPQDLEETELIRVNNEQAHFAGPGPWAPAMLQRTMWGVPVVATDAMPVNTALVGDFSKAILFDRESVTISIGTANDDFIRNIVRVLAEIRAGFAVARPAAFCKVTGI